MISDLYEKLPEVGDLDLPKLVFFFDEAHMLFEGTSKALIEKLEQVIRLIRSKGVGIYFITQSPTDVPNDILGQLGNRIQHALRAYTPEDQKAVRAAAETFRSNPDFNTEEAIMQLETGEALVSFLDEKGAPGIVHRAKILFPLSQIGAITAGQRLDIQNAAPVRIKNYQNYFDRESAYEIISVQNQEQEAKAQAEKEQKELEKQQKEAQKEAEKAQKEAEKQAKAEEKAKKAKSSGWKRTIFGTLVTTVIASVARSLGSSVGKAITGGSSSSKKSSTSATKSAAGKAAKSATTAVTKKVSEEILKSIFK